MLRNLRQILNMPTDAEIGAVSSTADLLLGVLRGDRCLDLKETFFRHETVLNNYTSSQDPCDFSIDNVTNLICAEYPNSSKSKIQSIVANFLGTGQKFNSNLETLFLRDSTAREQLVQLAAKIETDFSDVYAYQILRDPIIKILSGLWIEGNFPPQETLEKLFKQARTPMSKCNENWTAIVKCAYAMQDKNSGLAGLIVAIDTVQSYHHRFAKYFIDEESKEDSKALAEFLHGKSYHSEGDLLGSILSVGINPETIIDSLEQVASKVSILGVKANNVLDSQILKGFILSFEKNPTHLPELLQQTPHLLSLLINGFEGQGKSKHDATRLAEYCLERALTHFSAYNESEEIDFTTFAQILESTQKFAGDYRGNVFDQWHRKSINDMLINLKCILSRTSNLSVSDAAFFISDDLKNFGRYESRYGEGKNLSHHLKGDQKNVSSESIKALIKEFSFVSQDDHIGWILRQAANPDLRQSLSDPNKKELIVKIASTIVDEERRKIVKVVGNPFGESVSPDPFLQSFANGLETGLAEGFLVVFSHIEYSAEDQGKGILALKNDSDLMLYFDYLEKAKKQKCEWVDPYILKAAHEVMQSSASIRINNKILSIAQQALPPEQFQELIDQYKDLGPTKLATDQEIIEMGKHAVEYSAELHDALSEVALRMSNQLSQSEIQKMLRDKPLSETVARQYILRRTLISDSTESLVTPNYVVSSNDLEWILNEVPEQYKRATLKQTVECAIDTDEIIRTYLQPKFDQYWSDASLEKLATQIKDSDLNTEFSTRLLEVFFSTREIVNSSSLSWWTISPHDDRAVSIPEYKITFTKGVLNLIEDKILCSKFLAEFGSKGVDALVAALPKNVQESGFATRLFAIAVDPELPKELRTQAAKKLYESNSLEHFLYGNSDLLSDQPVLSALTEDFNKHLVTKRDDLERQLANFGYGDISLIAKNADAFPDVQRLAKAARQERNEDNRRMVEDGMLTATSPGYKRTVPENLQESTKKSVRMASELVRISRLLNSDPTRHPVPLIEIQNNCFFEILINRPDAVESVAELYGSMPSNEALLRFIKEGQGSTKLSDVIRKLLATEDFFDLMLAENTGSQGNELALVALFKNSVEDKTWVLFKDYYSSTSNSNRYLDLAIQILDKTFHSESDIREFISLTSSQLTSSESDRYLSLLKGNNVTQDPSNVHFYQTQISVAVNSPLPFRNTDATLDSRLLLCASLLASSAFSRDRCEIFRDILLDDLLPKEIRETAGKFFSTHDILSTETTDLYLGNENTSIDKSFKNQMLFSYLSQSDQVVRDRLKNPIARILSDQVLQETIEKLKASSDKLPNTLLLTICSFPAQESEIIDSLLRVSDSLDEVRTSRIVNSLLYLKERDVDGAIPELLHVLDRSSIDEFIDELDKICQICALFEKDPTLALEYVKNRSTQDSQERENSFKKVLSNQLEKLFGEAGLDAYTHLQKTPGFLKQVITWVSNLKNDYKYLGADLATIATEGHLDSKQKWNDWRFFGEGSEDVRAEVSPGTYASWTRGKVTWVGVFDEVEERVNRGITAQLESALEYGHITDGVQNPVTVQLDMFLRHMLSHQEQYSTEHIGKMLQALDTIIANKEITSAGKKGTLIDAIDSIEVDKPLTDRIKEGPLRRFKESIGRRYADAFPYKEISADGAVWTTEFKQTVSAIARKIKSDANASLNTNILSIINVDATTERPQLYMLRQALTMAHRLSRCIQHDKFSSVASPAQIKSLTEDIAALSVVFKDSPFLDDLRAIQSRIKLTEDPAANERHVVIETSLPEAIILCGKYPVNSGSCQNLERGAYKQGLMGYMNDPHNKVIYVLDEKKVSEEFKDLLRQDDFETALWGANIEELLTAAVSRSVIRLGAAKDTNEDALVIEPIYSSGSLGKEEGEAIIIEHLKVNYAQQNVALYKTKGEEKIHITKSRSRWGQYDDYVGAGGQVGSYDLSLNRLHTIAGYSRRSRTEPKTPNTFAASTERALISKLSSKIETDFTATKIAKFRTGEFKSNYEDRLRNLGADIIVIDNPSSTDELLLDNADGYYFKPEKIKWRLEVTTFDSYLASLNSKKRTKINSKIKKSETVIKDEGSLSVADFNEWYRIYDVEVAGKERGRRAIQENWAQQKESLEGYRKMFFRDPVTNKLLGGAILKEDANSKSLTIAYAAYDASAKDKELSVRTFKESLEYAQSCNLEQLSYGQDNNLYGHYLSVGLLEYKSSLGFIPKAAKNNQIIKVLNPSQFNDKYAFFSFDDAGSLALIKR